MTQPRPSDFFIPLVLLFILLFMVSFSGSCSEVLAAEGYFTYYKNNTYAAPTTYTQVAGNVDGTGEIHTTATLRVFDGVVIIQQEGGIGTTAAVFFYLGDDGATRIGAIGLEDDGSAYLLHIVNNAGAIDTGLGLHIDVDGNVFMDGKLTLSTTQIKAMADGTLSTDGATYGQLTTHGGVPGAHHDAVALLGDPDYLSIADQDITLGLVDLEDHITGVVQDGNVANDITLTNITQISTRPHSSTTGIGSNDHHTEAHTANSHSDVTTATGANLDTLTDDAMADALHRHSELSASDGTPNPAVQVDAAGSVGIGTPTPVVALEVGDANLTYPTPPSTSIVTGGGTSGRVTVEGSIQADILLDDSGGTANSKIGQFLQSDDVMQFRSLNDDGLVRHANILVFENATGNVAIGHDTPLATLHVVGDTRFGSPGYVEIEADGDVHFESGGGLQCGGISTEDNSAETAIGISNTWYQVTIFSINDPSNGSVVPDHTDDHITVGKAGIYLVNFSASVLSAGVNKVYEFEVKGNNGTNPYANVHSDRKIAVANDVGATSGCGLAAFDEDETVELWVRNKSDTTNLTFEDVTLTVVQVAGD